MLKHIGVGEEFECVVVRIGDRDVIVFASEGFDRREILPVGGKKEMRPFALFSWRTSAPRLPAML